MLWFQTEIKTKQDVENTIKTFKAGGYKVVGFDLETTGLNLLKDKMFAFSFGFKNNTKGYVFTLFVNSMQLSLEHKELINMIYENIFNKANFVFAHNAKYDLHILANSGVSYENNNVFCSKIMALNTFKDKTFKELSLKPLTVSLFGKDSILAANKLEAALKEKKEKFNIDLELFEALNEGRPSYKTKREEFLRNNPIPNYESLPKEIILPYALDDVKIMLDCIFYMFVANKDDPYFINNLKIECNILPLIVRMEKIGYLKTNNTKHYFTFNLFNSNSKRLTSGLQNTKKEQRNNFTTPPNYNLFCFDYNQIEFRLQSAFINDINNPEGEWKMPNLYKTRQDFDIHTQGGKFLQSFVKNNASGLDPRKVAKILNCGILYGASVSRLKEITKDFDLKEGFEKIYYDKFFEAFQGLVIWKELVKERFKQNGYVYNLFGQKLYGNGNYRNFNHLVQGSCTALLKTKLFAIDNFLRQNNAKSYIQFCIHDEIQVAIHNQEEHLGLKIKDLMEETYLEIPLKVKVKKTKNWE